jgi:hypothetical protein
LNAKKLQDEEKTEKNRLKRAKKKAKQDVVNQKKIDDARSENNNQSISKNSIDKIGTQAQKRSASPVSLTDVQSNKRSKSTGLGSPEGHGEVNKGDASSNAGHTTNDQIRSSRSVSPNVRLAAK